MLPPGLSDARSFPLVEALWGRRSRRFMLGASMPEGALAFASDREPMPLSEIEQMMLLTAAAGNTGWNYLIMRNPRYAPHLSSYACAAGGRVFSSAAGFETSELFFTDDNGVYFLATRDAPALADTDEHGLPDIEALLEAHRSRVRKIADGRLRIPAEEPYTEGHNLWCVNRPGTTLLIPVGDLAQHSLANLCYLLQNGYVIYDDIHNERIPGLEPFRHLADIDNPYPLTYIEQTCLMECSAELSMACYAGMLMLQAMGLGGWLFDGMDPYAMLGASDDPDVPGLGFRYDTSDKWTLPNPTGLPGVFEGFCPPHHPDMRTAVEALTERKFGPGGPFNPGTPGPWQDSPKVRGSAQAYSEEFRDCVGVMAQYVHDRFGRFPGMFPSILTFIYLQAHHLDLEFYDTHFKAGAYLRTHAQHMEKWHSAGSDEA